MPERGEVPFSAVAEANLGRGFSEIERVDGKRVLYVTADVDKQAIEPQKIISEISENFMPELLSKHPGVRYSMSGEAEEQEESMGKLKQGAILGIFLIFALMAIPLKSYVQPLIIISAIPFGIVGAVFGHWFLGLPLSILSLCGIIALAGVVVNDSLVMVDFINQKLGKGVPIFEAVMESGVARFRAIMLTSVTTFFGLLPMLMEKDLQAQFLIPMAASLAFGIIFATVITLFLIPSLYIVLADIKGLFTRKRFEDTRLHSMVPETLSSDYAS